jgi:putative heme iron utilization protein
MTQETGISSAVSDRICKHMNDDHSDAIVQYAQVYGHCEGATAAVMEAIDPLGMDIIAQVDGQPTPVRVTFDRELADAKDAHHVLVEMLKAVRTQAN